MTEHEWLTSSDPVRLLEMVQSSIHARKLRLFAVACGRRVCHPLADSRSRRLVDLAEQIADDRNVWESVGPSIDAAREALQEAFGPITGLGYHLESLLADDQAACVVPFFLLWRAKLSAFEDTFALMRGVSYRFPGEGETLRQCELLRCVVGNPFRQAALDPAWLSWDDGAVVRLAQYVYDDRAFDYLPVLGDALEDAGCCDADVLGHCRRPGPHARGCWVIDLILGKQ